MPRIIPSLSTNFDQEISRAEALVLRLENAHLALENSRKPERIGHPALEMSYELAYLRIFIAWEVFLEQVFYRLWCGHAPRGQPPERCLAGMSYCRTIAIAESTLLGGRSYALWHNPSHIVIRANRFFQPGNFALVIQSNQSKLDEYAAARHRVAHGQGHARQRFDLATMNMASRRYSGGRPGRFLRDQQRGNIPPRRWLNAISADLSGLAHQICP